MVAVLPSDTHEWKNDGATDTPRASDVIPVPKVLQKNTILYTLTIVLEIGRSQAKSKSDQIAALLIIYVLFDIVEFIEPFHKWATIKRWMDWSLLKCHQVVQNGGSSYLSLL